MPLVLVAAVSILVHAPNLLNYPAWFFDEGAYITYSHQWARTGQLSYYQHPFGAFLILAPLFLIANPTSYLIPRILMVAFSAVDGILLYKVARAAYSRSEVFALVAAIVYVATPLSARYLRLVVVDNFMTLFLLLSLLVVLTKPKDRMLSPLMFGAALISKQTALFFLPALFFIFWRQKRPVSRTIVWTLVAGVLPTVWAVYGVYEIGLSSLVSSQVGLTSLTGERAVSALSLIIQRISSRDPFIFLGLAGILWAVYKKDSMVTLPLAYLGSFVVLFLKISTVYMIPALPFFALVGTGLLFDLVDRVPRLFTFPRAKISFFGAVMIALIALSLFLVVTQSPAAAQQDAVTYLAGQSSPSAIVSYTYLWIFQQNYPGVTVYDRYAVPWIQLHNQPVYLIVDFPGDLNTISAIPQYQQLYNNSTLVWTQTTNGYTVRILKGTAP